MRRNNPQLACVNEFVSQDPHRRACFEHNDIKSLCFHCSNVTIVVDVVQLEYHNLERASAQFHSELAETRTVVSIRQTLRPTNAPSTPRSN